MRLTGHHRFRAQALLLALSLFALRLHAGPIPDSLLRLAALPAIQENPDSLAGIYLTLARHYSINNDLGESERFASLALEAARRAGNYQKQFSALSSLGYATYTVGGDRARAIRYYEDAEALALAHPDAIPEKSLSFLYGRLAEVSNSLKDEFAALLYNSKALEISVRYQDARSLAFINRNLGIFFLNQELYDRSSQYLDSSLRYLLLLKDSSNYHGVLLARISNDMEQERYDSAFRRLAFADTLSRRLGNPYRSLGTLTYYARKLGVEGRYAEGIRLADSVANAFEAMGFPGESCNALLTSAELAYDQGDRAGAMSIIARIEGRISQIGYELLLPQVYELKLKIFEDAGDYVSAYRLLKSEKMRLDSLRRVESESKIRAFDKIIESEQYNLRLRKLDEAGKQQQIMIWAAVALLLLLLLLGGGFLIRSRLRTLRRMNEQLSQKNEVIRMSNERLKNATRDLRQFAYITAHDLREPLRTIGGFASLLKRRYHNKLDDSANEFLDYINAGVGHMSNLLSDLLTYSTIGIYDYQYEEVKISEVITQALQEMNQEKPVAGLRINLHNLPSIRADRKQMLQLFTQLLDNARKFRQPEIPPVVEVSSRDDGDFVILSVKDNGIGIEPAYQEKIFNLFIRLHDSRSEYGGTGVGLSIAKKIVEHHKGKIWIESRPGAGTTVFIRLPKAPDQLNPSGELANAPEELHALL